MQTAYKPQGFVTHPPQEREATLGTATKRYCDLRRGDEIETYLGAKLQRAKVLDIQPDRPGYVRVLLQRPSIKTEIKWQTFTANATVEVVERGLIATQYQALVAELLPIEEPAKQHKALAETAQKSGIKVSRYYLRQACTTLASQGVLIEKKHKQAIVYRQPIPRQFGFPVIEHPGTRSERYGYYIGHKFCHQTKQEEAVFAWISGGSSFSREEFIEPVAQGWKRKWVSIAQRMIEQGDRLSPDISLRLISGLLRNEAKAFLALADLLNISHVTRNQLRDTERLMVIQWLDFVSPVWVKEERSA